VSEEGRLSHRPQRTVSDFFELAEDLRRVFDDRFLEPRALHPARFLWDYWHVPDQFTYFRTYADEYFPGSLYGRFLQRVRLWGQEELGCGKFSPIWLSYYVEGCTQQLHVDASHGPWSFVYSLTRWDTRRFTGGETMLLRPDGSLLTVPSRFNQWLVFDPRIPHGVTRVSGTQDPREARVVLHGWFKEPTLRCEGDLSLLSCQRQLERAWPELRRSLEWCPELEGLAVIRAEIGHDGAVEDVQVLANLTTPATDESPREAALDSVCSFLRTLNFSDVTHRARITIPIRFPLSPSLVASEAGPR
jgi:hypothetical protein